MPTMTPAVADAAETIQREHLAGIDRVVNDASLSIAGKRQAAAQVHQRQAAAMQTLQDNFHGGAAVTAGATTRQLFGSETPLTGADALSMRDARDRARRLDDPREALDLLRDAESGNDPHLAQAIAEHAYRGTSALFGSAWNDVLATYTASRPAAATRIAELAAAESNAATDGVDHAFTFYLSKPNILVGLTDPQIEALASQAPA